MATEADNPELMSQIGRDGLNRNLDKGEFNLPPETGDYLIKSEKLQEPIYVGVEAAQIGFKASARVPEGEIFLESSPPPIAKVAGEETSGKEETSHNNEIPYQAQKKMLESGSQREQDERVDVAEEKGSKMNEDVDEIKDAVEKSERTINIVDTTGIISHEEKMEKSLLGIGEEKATREETTFERVQAIANDEDGSLLKNEEEGSGIKEIVVTETTKEVSVHESGLGQNEEVAIQTADHMVNNSNTGVETATDAYEKTEIKESILGTETTIVEENIRGKIVELEVDSQSCFNEENVSKTIETTENEKESAIQVSIGEAYSIVEASPDENKKEAIKEIGEAVEGKPNEPSAILGDVKEDDSNGDDSELLDVKGISEKGTLDGEKEAEQNFQADKPGEKLEKSNKLMSAATDAANYGEVVDNPENVKVKSPEESVKQDVKNVQNNEKKVEASNREILEKPDTARTGESIAHETKENDEGLHASLPTLLVKEEESLQEGGNITPPQSSEVKKEEDKSIVMAVKENVSSTGLEYDNQESEKEILQHQDDMVAAETEPLNLCEKADDLTTVNETVVILDCEEMIEKLKKEKNGETVETKATKVSVEEDIKVVAEASDANEGVEVQAVEATSTTGEIEVEKLKKTYELGSMEMIEGKDAKENTKEQTNKEDKKEGYGENENAVLGKMSVKHIISEEQFGADISPQYSGEEAVLSHQEGEEEKTKEEIHKEPEKNSADKDAVNQATEEAKIVNDQSIEQSGETVTEDNVKIKVPQPEIHKEPEKNSVDKDADNQATEEAKIVNDQSIEQSGEIVTEDNVNIKVPQPEIVDKSGTARTGESIEKHINKIVEEENNENSNTSLPTSLARERQSLQGGGGNITPEEALSEEDKEVETTIKSVENNVSRTRPDGTHQESGKEKLKVEEHVIQDLQKSAPGEQLEQPAEMAAETETLNLYEKADDITSENNAEVIEIVEETMGKEKEGGTEDIDEAKVKKAVAEENTEVVASDSKEGMEIEDISAKSKAGETKLEILKKTCESVSKENPDGEEIRKNIEQKTEEDIEEEHGDIKNAGLNDDAIQHIIVEKHIGTDASPQYSGVETAVIYKDEAEVGAKTRKEVHEETEEDIVDKSTGEQALEDANKVINQSTEQSGEAVAEDDAKEYEIIQISEKNGDDGSQTIEGCAMKENFEVPVRDTDKEGTQQKEDESDTMKMKEDVEHLNSGSVEPLDARGSMEAIESETLKDKEEPDNVPYPAAEVQALAHESNERGVGISSWENRNGEEVAVKEESSVNDSISVSITALPTQTIVREPEDLDSLMKGTIDAEDTLDKAVIDAKPMDASKPVEKVGHKIPAATDKAEEGTKQETKTESEVQGNENQEELRTTVTASGDLQADNLQESSTLSSKEFELKKSVASEITDEIPAKEQTAYESAETVRTPPERESVQSEDETTNVKEVYGLGSVDHGIESTTNGNLQGYEEHVSRPEDGKMPKETRDLVEQEEIHKPETLDLQHVESPSERDDALKCMESIDADRKETVLDEEDSTKKSEVSLKEAVMIEGVAVGHEAGDHKQELEHTETNKCGTLKEENLELAESGKEQESASDRVTSDASDGTLPKSIPDTVEDIRSAGLDQISVSIAQVSQESQAGQAEIQEKAEPELDDEEPTRETHKADEMIKTVISVEKMENSESIEQLEATGSVEAIESETLKDKEEPDNVPYPVAEVALVHESNERGVGISSWENRSGEEVAVKEESSVNDSISVSMALPTQTMVREPEDLDSLMKGTIDVEEGTLDKAVIDAEPEDASKPVEKVGHKIPAATDKAEEGTKQETKTESEVQGNENQEELRTTVTASGDLQADNLQASSTLSSKEFELKKSVASEITDEIPAKEQTAYESAETVRTPPERESVQSEDETTNVKEVYGLGSVDHGIESTTNENLQGYEEHVSRPEDGKMPKETRDLVEQEEIHKPETLDLQHVESPSERDDALKCMESIDADRKETVLDEEDSTKKSEVSLKEAVMIEGVAVGHEAGDHKQELEHTETNKCGTLKEENLELAESGKEQESASERVTSDPGDGTLLESIPNTVEDIRSAGLDQIFVSIAQVSQESQASQAEIQEKAKPELDDKEPTRETHNTDEMIKPVISVEKMENSESIEQLEATGSVEAIESETLKDKEEPDNVSYPAAEVQALVHESNEKGVVLSSWETRSGEEVAVKEESSVNDSISVSITALATETIVEEPEDLASPMKGATDVDEATPDKADIDAKPEDASNLVEKVDNKIPAAMDKTEEDTKQETKMESEMQGNENAEELMTTAPASGDLQVDNLQEASTLSSKEFEVKTSEASEIIDKTPAKDQTAYENAETLRIPQEKESAQNEDETTNAIEVSGVGSVDSGIETTTTENVQPYEEHVSSPRGGEMPKMEETTNLVDQEEIHKLETLDLQHEESPSARADTLKYMESTGEDRKETILGEEDPVKKSEVSLKEAIMIQEAVVGCEAVDHKQKLDPTETNKYDTLKGEKLELAESGKEQKCTSERVTSDQSDGTMPESIPNTDGEIRNVGLDQSSESIAQMSQGFQAEIEKRAEPELDVEGPTREMQDTEEMIKTAISAEKVNEEVQRADGDETVKETKEEENDIKEIHTIPTAEGADEVKETSAASTEYLLAEDSNDQTEIVDLDTQAAPSTEKQILLTKDEKGEKVEGERSERPAVTSLALNEESGETIKEIMEEAVICSDETKATTVIDATQVIGLEEAPIDDTKVHVSGLASRESIPQEVAYETNKLDGIALEESSSHLTSQLATADHDNLTSENIAPRHSEESQQASDAIEEHTESEVTTDQAFPEEISKEHHQIATLALPPQKEDHETKGTIENVEKNTKEMVTRKDASLDEAHAETVQTSDEIKQKKESSECISKSSEGFDATKEDGTTSVQALNEEDIEEQFQTRTSELLPEDQEHGTSATAVRNEHNANKVEVQEDNSKTTKETSLCREETKELKVPQIVVQLDKDMKKEGEKEAHEGEGMALYKIKEETEKASELVSESDSHVFESEGDGLIVSAQTPVVEQLEEQHKTPSSALYLEDKVHETSATTVSTEDMVKEVEVLEDESKTTKEASLQMYEPKELEITHLELPLEKDKQDENPNEVHEREITKKASELVSKSDPNVFESVEEGIIISAETPAAEQLEEQNPTPSTAFYVEEQDHGASPTILSMEEERKEAELQEDETRTTEKASSQTDEPKDLEFSHLELPVEKDAQDKNPDEVHERQNGDPNETKEEDSKATDAVFVSDTHGPEATKENEINITMPTQKSEDTTPSASLVSKEQDHRAAIAMENTEQQSVETPVNENAPTFPAPKTTEEICFPTEETRDLELSGFENEIHKDIQKDTPDELMDEVRIPKVLELHPQEYESKKTNSECPAEFDKTTEVTGPLEETSNLITKTSEEVLESVPKVHDHEILNETEEAGTKDKDPEAATNEFTAGVLTERTTDTTETIQNEVTNEESAEEKEDAKISQPATLVEEATKESCQKHKLEAEESPGEETATETIHNEELHEEIKMGRVKAETKTAKDFQPAAVENETFKEEQGQETSREEGPGDFAEASAATSNLDQGEKTLVANSEQQISKEAEPCAPAEAKTTDIPQVQRDPLVETTRSVDIEALQPEDSGGKFSLLEMMQRSTRERQAAAGSAEEKETITSKAEPNVETVETGETKLEGQEEEEGEHKKSESSPDAPVMVEATKGTATEDAKAAHKKSHHNILSGVGSKVKHSISKVKKAITGGKSSHPKQHSPK